MNAQERENLESRINRLKTIIDADKEDEKENAEFERIEKLEKQRTELGE